MKGVVELNIFAGVLFIFCFLLPQIPNPLGISFLCLKRSSIRFGGGKFKPTRWN